MHPEQVAIYRERWESDAQSRIIREYWDAKFDALIAERLSKLRKCSPEDLKGLQEALNALDLAKSIVAERIVSAPQVQP